MRKYYIENVDDYYVFHVIEDGNEYTELVDEYNIDGFVQCLKSLGYNEQ